ncbi:helix-turn-helix domain-containing protein [Variovorax sp. AFSI2.2]|uniref:helix-turn-helix domain-containing protein n=1 Tax=Variovorax sp. AFSI2.2 TaxID=3384160 RepID=UPI003EBE4D4E
MKTDNILAGGDSAPANVDGASLGEEIRKLRKARGYSLTDVATAISRSISFISQLERGNASPSIADLRGIAQKLEVPLGWFFSHDQVPSNERGKIVRSTERRRLGTVTSGLLEELLSPDIGGAFEMFLSTFEPGAALRTFNQRDTEEEGYVVRGSLNLWIGKKRFTVNAGDSFRIVREPFRWANPTKEDAVVVWVISPPTY